jgi:N-acyl-L-homoserine lactone synthetase
MVPVAHATSRSQRLSDLLNRVDYKLAETEADKEIIYRLRYRAYRHEGAVQPNAEHKISDQFDDAPNSWIIGVYFDGELASSLRISVSSPKHPVSPSVNVFPDLLDAEVAQAKVMVDPTRFVGDPVRENRFPELPYMTLRLAYIACEHFNADIGLASVRAEHQAFYRRVFLHRPISTPRIYPGLTKPICLMAVDYPAMREKVFARYPYFRSSQFERRMLFDRASRHDSAAGVLATDATRDAERITLQPGQNVR